MLHADAIDALETLQFHSNDELRVSSCQLVDEFFGDDYTEPQGDSAANGSDADAAASRTDELPPWRNATQGFSF